MRRWWTFLFASALVLTSRLSLAESWVYEGDDPDSLAARRLRFLGRLSIDFGEFKRPETACGGGVPLFIGGLPPSAYCGAEASDEVAIGGGAEVSFRAFGPVHFTFGVDAFYTQPSSSAVIPQFMLMTPFGLLLTFPEWSLRPMVQATVTPVLYLTDDARDYLVGLAGGFGWRILDWGEVSISLQYQDGATANLIGVRLGAHPF